MTISVNPACRKRRKCQPISGVPATSSKGLGVWSVSGRMRSPRPAANIIAFMGVPIMCETEKVSGRLKK